MWYEDIVHVSKIVNKYEASAYRIIIIIIII